MKPPAALRNCLKNKSKQDRESKKHFLCLLIFQKLYKNLKTKISRTKMRTRYTENEHTAWVECVGFVVFEYYRLEQFVLS